MKKKYVLKHKNTPVLIFYMDDETYKFLELGDIISYKHLLYDLEEKKQGSKCYTIKRYLIKGSRFRRMQEPFNERISSLIWYDKNKGNRIVDIVANELSFNEKISRQRINKIVDITKKRVNIFDKLFIICHN